MIKLMVHTKDVDESILIQKAAFAAGYGWIANGQVLDHTNPYWITLRPEELSLRQSRNPDFMSRHDFTEKTVADILRMLGASQDIDCTIPEDKA
jgi:hypothetical protein